MKLYEINREIDELMSMVGESPSEESGLTQEEHDSAVLDRLGQLQMEFAHKVEHVAMIVKNELAEAAKFKTESDFYANKARTHNNKAAAAKNFITTLMQIQQVKKVEGEKLTMALQKNPPRVDDYAPNRIPEEYWIPQPPKLDKKDILKVLKSGAGVPGCSLVQSESLRIR